MNKLSKQERLDRAKSYAKVFGNVNAHATKRDGKRTMRVGKTSRDKAKGHIPYTKNRRIWDSKSHTFVKA